VLQLHNARRHDDDQLQLEYLGRGAAGPARSTPRGDHVADLQGSAVDARKRRSSIQASVWTMVAA